MKSIETLQESHGKGTLAVETFYSKELKKEWNYSVYLPFGYENSEDTYPVMYMLHGLTDDHQSWMQKGSIENVLDEYISQDLFPPCVVIFPDGQNAWYSDIPTLPMRSAFTNDLFPFIEKKYRLIHAKKARAIGGLSMGGHGALLFSLLHPEYFSAAFILSPAITEYGKSPSDILINTMKEEKLDHVYGNPFSQSKWDSYSYHEGYNQYTKGNEKVQFFIGTGLKDLVTPVENVKNLVSNFTRDNVEYMYTEVPDGEHEWAVWIELMKQVLPFLKKNFLA